MGTPPEGLGGLRGPNYVGNIFFGSAGFLIVDHSGFQVYKSTAGDVSGAATLGAGGGSREKYEKTMEEKGGGEDTEPHMQNWFAGIRARDYKVLHADIEIGARSAAFCHLANIAYRVGRTLRVSDATGRIMGDEQAGSMSSRNYRAPYVVPESI